MNTNHWRKRATRRVERRLALGLTQADLARRIAVSGAALNRWERQSRRPLRAMEQAWDAALDAAEAGKGAS